MSEEINKRIGDYQILNELGSGGMGRVYRVRNVISDRVEAMKVLLPDLAGRQELAARFLREIKLMASLNHPNIAALRTAFTGENQLVMIMEYVEGTTVANLLERGPIPAQDVLNFMDQVLNALGYAHEQHIIHRDIKPSNMMLTPQGVIKLMDFGIARAGEERSLTMSGTTLGSLAYMSPEQVKGEPTDARSDLYSVGVSIYEMVTGQRPFQATSDYSIMAAHVKEMPKPPIELLPSLPPALNEIILMAIAKDPAHRFQSAAAFRNALGSIRTATPASPVASLAGTPTMDSVLPVAAWQSAPATHPSPISASAAVLKDSSPVVPTPALTPPPPPARPATHRGLYMTLGALIVLAVLVVAGIYVPRMSKTQATTSAPAPPAATTQPADTGSQASSAGEAQPSQPAPAPAAVAPATPTPGQDWMQPPAPAEKAAASVGNPNFMQQQVPLAAARERENSSSTPGSAMLAKPPAAHAKKFAAAGGGATAATLPIEEEGASPSEDTSDAGGLDQLEREIDELSTRAAAVDTNLERLKQEQAAAAYGLRGDMAARQMSMKNNLAKAQDAVQRRDLARARKYTKMVAADVETLERFLGR